MQEDSELDVISYDYGNFGVIQWEDAEIRRVS